jgi:hypothetical protein
MTDRDKLPVRATTGNVVVPTEQSGSLVRVAWRPLETDKFEAAIRGC